MSDPQASPLGRYFDHNGSTPLHPDVLRLCQELSLAEWGNSAAPHPMGRAASHHIETARQTLRLLAESPSSDESEEVARKDKEDLEASVRLARMELSDLQGLPLPSQ